MRALACWGLLIIVSGAALSACDPGEEGLDDGGGGGSGGSGGTGGSPPDARAVDMAAGGGSYQWLAIFDNDPQPICTGTGPGADIDSVDVYRGAATTTLGVGLKGSAIFLEGQMGGPTTVSCSTCGSAMTTCPHSGTMAAPRAEGIQDGMSYQNMPDVGYISLNAGTLWLKIGRADGMPPAQEIRSGDRIIVREVDKYYVAQGTAYAGCPCAPEKYTVYAYVEMGMAATRVKLRVNKYWSENMETCGMPNADSIGCGTTEFIVP